VIAEEGVAIITAAVVGWIVAPIAIGAGLIGAGIYWAKSKR